MVTNNGITDWFEVTVVAGSAFDFRLLADRPDPFVSADGLIALPTGAFALEAFLKDILPAPEQGSEKRDFLIFRRVGGYFGRFDLGCLQVGLLKCFKVGDCFLYLFAPGLQGSQFLFEQKNLFGCAVFFIVPYHTGY